MAKFLEAKHENKLESPGGRGVQNKKPSIGGVWIFSGTAHCSLEYGKGLFAYHRLFWPQVEGILHIYSKL